MDQEIELVDGPSWLTLGWSSMKYLLAAFACVLLAVPGQYFPPFWWIGWTSAAIALALMYGVRSFRSQHVLKLEAARGYTTALRDARVNRRLAFVDGRDGSIVSLPGEPLPPSGRNRDVDATRIANGHPKRNPAH